MTSQFTDGYEEAIEDVRRVGVYTRLNGNAFSDALDTLLRKHGIEIEPRMGLAIRVTERRG